MAPPAVRPSTWRAPRPRRALAAVGAVAGGLALAAAPAHADPGIIVRANTSLTVTGGSVTLTITNLLPGSSFQIQQERPIWYASNYSCPLGDKFAVNADGNRFTGTVVRYVEIPTGATATVKLSATSLKVGEGLAWTTKVDPLGCQRYWTDFTHLGVTGGGGLDPVETAVPLRKLF